MTKWLSFTSVLAATVVASAQGWSKLAPFTVTTAPKVSGHSVGSFLPKSQDKSDTKHEVSVISFGGLTGPAGSACTDATWIFENQEWTEIDTPVKPRVRMYAASAVVDKNLYVLGGWDPGAPGSGGEFLQDIWAFDFQQQTWNELDLQLPFAVSRHAACALGNQIIVHTFKGTFVFDTEKCTLSEQVTCGDMPEGLSMCAMAPLNDSQLLLFGGSTKTQALSSDAYVLDTKTWTWTKMIASSSSSSQPPPLASSCAAMVKDNQVLVFGGACLASTGYQGGMGLMPQNDAWLLDVDSSKNTASWTCLDLSSNGKNEAPQGRVAASLSPLGQTSFLLQGGYDPVTKSTFEEPWILDL